MLIKEYSTADVIASYPKKLSMRGASSTSIQLSLSSLQYSCVPLSLVAKFHGFHPGQRVPEQLRDGEYYLKKNKEGLFPFSREALSQQRSVLSIDTSCCPSVWQAHISRVLRPLRRAWNDGWLSIGVLRAIIKKCKVCQLHLRILCPKAANLVFLQSY